MKKTMPKGEARPLGTKARRAAKPKPQLKIVQREPKIVQREKKEKVDIVSASEVVSSSHDDGPAIPPVSITETQIQESVVMTFTHSGTSKNGKNAMYRGAANVLRIPLAAFVGGVAPATFDVENGVFAGPKQKKVKLTKEERAALPKPTLAEKIARRQKQLDALRAKAATELQTSL